MDLFAAFFLCERAASVLQNPTDEPQDPIQIASIAPYYSASETQEGDAHSIRIETNMSYETVEWRGGADEPAMTASGPGAASVFSHTYDGLGTEDGNDVVVTAAVTDADENTATAEQTITVTAADADSTPYGYAWAYHFSPGHNSSDTCSQSSDECEEEETP